MKLRRRLTFAVGAAGAGHALRLFAQTPTPSAKRLGILTHGLRANAQPFFETFADEMGRAGWQQGRNIVYDWSSADGRQALLRKRAEELVARKPDVIYAGSQAGALAAKQATDTIPIVFVGVTSPVELGLVSSLSHPGANVTGLSTNWASLWPKRAQLLREIMPKATRLGVLRDPDNPLQANDLQALAQAAPALGWTLVHVDFTDPLEIDKTMDSFIAARVDAIHAEKAGGALVYARERLFERANRARLPVIVASQGLAHAGALFSYGADSAGIVRSAAQLVDRILRGARPADMPVEQFSRIKFVVNAKASRLLGLSIPQAVLLRADEVIE